MFKKFFILTLLLLSDCGRQYLFAKPTEGISIWRSLWCRIKGHETMIWFNPGGEEPDTRCKNCLDDLG